jgi:1,4-dihydroxy-2-naphthoate octaprenyltransferase
MGFVTAFSANLSVSYSNDYFDLDVDQHGTPNLVSGGSGVLLQHPELREFSKRFAQVLMGISISIAFLTTILFSLSLFIPLIVIVANLIGWYYAAPPLRLAYRGLSEVSVVITVGLLLPGFGYLINHPPLTLTYGFFLLPLVLYSLAFIISVEIPDLESDKRGGKNNLIVRSGLHKTSLIIVALFGSSTLYFLVLASLNPLLQLDFRIFTLLSLIPFLSGLWQYRTQNKRESTTRSIQHILLSFVIFLISIDIYLITILLPSI